MANVSSWDKFVLLLWKNWKLQWHHKWQLVIELLLPAIFSLLLVLVRALVVAEPKDVKTYDELNITTLELFKDVMQNSRRMNAILDMFMSKNRTSATRSLTLRTINFTLYYSPANALLDSLVGETVQTLDMNLAAFKGLTNANELEYHMIQDNVFAGIQFDDSWANLTDTLPEKFSFALRFPSELRTSTLNIGLTWLTMRLFPIIDLTGPRNAELDDGGIPVGYLREGFLPVQNALTMAYLRQKSQMENIPEVVMQRYPYPQYIFDPLLEGLASIMSLIILLSFIYPCTHITKYITSEKEYQLKEVMKIMGLGNWLHWLAWFVKSFIMLTISAIFIVILVKIRWKDDVSVLTFSDFTVLIVFFIVYIVASICFCFMLATFFSKASTAAAVSGLVWFIAYIPFSFTINTYSDLSLSTKLGWSLMSNTAMGFGIKLILEFEGTGEGLQWSNLFTPVSVDDTLTVGAIMIMMLIASVLYMLICLYVEAVFPGNFGVAKKWNFLFTREFWCGHTDYVGIEDMPNGAGNMTMINGRDPDAFESEPESKHIGLQVRNLRKRFANKYAVNGLSINMYEDEITVLLGHNGAGKTTTISMLTGMFPPTSGTAIINGSDIRTNIEGARMSLGICPQHNVLFGEMSVSDHIRFFSRMKGLHGADVEREVVKYLRMIELEDKADVASAKLSGGMKRKLSVCCALCGDTKVVLCDEPSSGMDPSARRQMWDLLQQEKIGRTLLLTTHFMDEADILGDRIAIMCDGELKCHGTSFFLKKKYGSGYHLICVKRKECEPREVTKLLNEYIPELRPESDIGAELSYQLPDRYAARFEEMFGALEQHSERLYLSGYGIGISSMEEVFMKVGAEKNANGEAKDQNAIMNGATGYPTDDDIESVQSERVFSDSQRMLQGQQLCMNQWRAMLLKKLLYTYRNKLLFVIQNIMPIFFVVMTVLITRTQGTFRELDPISISLQQYPVAVTVMERSADVVSGSQAAIIADEYEKIAQSYGTEYSYLSTGTQTFTDYILELGKAIQVRINSRYLAAATIANDKIIAWLNNQPLHTAPLTVNLVHNAMAHTLIGPNANIEVINAPLPYTTQTILTQLNTGNNLGTQLSTNLCFCMCFVSAMYILFLVKERESRSKLLQFVGGVKVWTYWLSQLLWDYATYTFTAFLVVATIACFQEDGLSTFTELARYFALLLLFGCAVLPFTYLASLFFSEPATGFARISIINIFAGMALFIVVVVMSFEFFDIKSTADILGWIFRIFPHFSLAMGLNKLYTNVATRNTCDKIIFPPPYLCVLAPKCCDIKPYFGWAEPGVLPETIYMLATGLVLFLFLVMREFGVINELIYMVRNRTIKPPPPPEDGYLDDDVENERQRILNMNNSDLMTKNLVLDRVTKYYDKFLAVNQVSLCVQDMECFGLLGVNGAGKTTTFKMMTGDERISSGSAYVQGLNLETDMNNIYKRIGYCPQFDALLDDLTGRETLRIFCLLRGVQSHRINQLSEDLAKSFGFMKHIDKETRAYSGGNKRKLSTAIALIGSPSVIYLDEPTTGMDPAARRQLWNMVCRIRDAGKSIVLTSHSMEECEALCTRLAIMVNGEFKCIGAPQHLKNKFSKGLILKIKVRRNMDMLRQARLSLTSGHNRHADEPTVATQIAHQDINNVKEFVNREFPESILQEEYQGILTFYIPLSGIKWSQIFGLMERKRDEMNIEDYSISQTTLEEIFLEFAKYQREDPRAMK